MLPVREDATQYILSCIDHSDRDDWPQETLTDTEKLTFLKQTFEAEYWHEQNRKRYPSRKKAIEEWLRGLPSAFNCHYLPHDIQAQYKEWSISGPYETYPQYFNDRWFKDMGFLLDRLMP